MHIPPIEQSNETGETLPKEPIKPSHLEHLGPLALASLCRSHRLPLDRSELFQGIAQQWREFDDLRPTLPAAATVTYGVGPQMPDGAESLDYCCAVSVAPEIELPVGLNKLQLPPMHCAVFELTGHASEMRELMEMIFATALPIARLEPAEVDSGLPEFIERHGPHFNKQTGLGGLEVLIPLKN